MKCFKLSIPKINNRGFAISGILYATLILFLMLMLGTLSILANGKFLLDKTKNDLVDYLNNEEPYTSGASAPEISSGMIPIKWSGTDWVKADVNNEMGLNQWYDYDGKKWANIALVTSTTRATYESADLGTIINEVDVLAYLVWIPRYRYRLFNVEALAVPIQTIQVVFEDKDTPKSNGGFSGEWLTHPAFTFGNEELNGFWVGKFETTGDEITPTIKPNLVSLVSQNISTQFTTSQKFNNSLYGLTVNNNSHIMKNIEWGAVAYLSQSIYGKYGNLIYTDEIGLEKEIYINNINTDLTTGNGPTITGCAADTVNADMIRSSNCPIGNQYQTTQGVKASTTGNIYGIYDMSGGSWEYTMGAMYNIDNLTIMISNSGFTQEAIDDINMISYVDKYTYGTTYTDQIAYDRRLLGDSTGEVRAWNGDFNIFIYNTYPWFIRGGVYLSSIETGIFGFGRATGGANSAYSFRVVLFG